MRIRHPRRNMSAERKPEVWWHLPANDQPSKGIDMIHEVAACARELGIPGGLVADADGLGVRSASEVVAAAKPGDILFLHFVRASGRPPWAAEWPGAKWVFVQGASTLMTALAGDATGREGQDFAGAWAVMPHLVALCERWLAPRAGVHLVPPCHEPDPAAGDMRKAWGARQPGLVLFPKAMYTALGQTDHTLLSTVLTETCRTHGWRLTQLRDLSPLQVQRTFADARLFINTNTIESLNATVIEAMAAGCVVHTYSAIGGRDFLRDGWNARVFENLEVFQQLDAAIALIEGEPSAVAAAETMQINGWTTAAQFSRQRTKDAVARWYNNCIST
ncbi:glycosyltransferase [bacterium]|nr:glycosyltransferase [bacterium]